VNRSLRSSASSRIFMQSSHLQSPSNAIRIQFGTIVYLLYSCNQLGGFFLLEDIVLINEFGLKYNE